MIRVALDARRQRDNGVARVTRLVATALTRLPIQLVLLGPVDELRSQFPETLVVTYDAPLLSLRDLHGLSHLLDSLGVDCFVAPQFYNSPWTACPQVRILHDTFPFEPGARLPRASDAGLAFGIDALRRRCQLVWGRRAGRNRLPPRVRSERSASRSRVA
jgi:hypothetical protein